MTAVLLGLLALAVPVASAGSAQPNPTDPLLVAGLNAVGPIGQNVYLQTPLVTQTIRVHSVVVGPNLVFSTAWSNATQPATFATTLLSNTTWVNVTRTCGAHACPVTSLKCDSVTYTGFGSAASLKITRACWTLGILFSGATLPAALGQTPNYTVVRLLEFETLADTQWFHPSTSTEAMSQGLSIYSATAFGTTSNYSVPRAAWAIPYPPGTWDPSQTTAYYTNLSQAIPVVDIYQTQRAIGLVWLGIPPGIQNYSVTIHGQPGSEYNGGFGNGTNAGYGNGSLSQPLDLVVTNVSNGPSGAFAATVSWTNIGTQPFNGQVNLMGSWVGTATDVSVTVNGNPVASYLTGGAVTIPPLTVNITNGSTAVFVVAYQVSSSFSFATSVFQFGSLSVNWLQVLGLVGLGVAIVQSYTSLVGWARFTVTGISGTLMLVGVVGLWIGLP